MSEKGGLIGPGIENKRRNQPPAPKPLLDKKLWLTVTAVIVVLLLLASIAYVVTRPEKKELSGAISPSSIQIGAGQSIDVEVSAQWGGDPVVDAENLAYAWSVSEPGLGSISNAISRQATFHAGEMQGSGIVSCNITYVHGEKEYWFVIDADLTVGPPVLESISVTPSEVTLLFDTVQVFNATAVNSLNENMSGANIAWTVAGILVANYTLDTTTGPSVNFTANATGTVWVNATLSHSGIVKSASAVVTMIREVPVLDITRSNLPDGVNWTFSEPSSAVEWSDLVIVVTDGTNSVNWTITAEGLDGGSYSVVECPSQDLDGLIVYLNITDTTGNGTVNAGDSFTITASGGTFVPASHYRVTLIYGPTEDMMVSKRFND